MKKPLQLLDAHTAYLRQSARPAGRSANAKVILADAAGVPSLAKYLGREGEEVYGGR